MFSPSNVRTIITVTNQRQSAPMVIRYIAESKIDFSREGLINARPLFDGKDDEIDYRAAGARLGPSALPASEIVHFIIFVWEEDLRRVEEQLRYGLKRIAREITRSIMQGIEAEIGAAGIRWIACTHFNDEMPHVHILLSRLAADPVTSAPRRIHILPPLLTLNEPSTAYWQQLS